MKLEEIERLYPDFMRNLMSDTSTEPPSQEMTVRSFKRLKLEFGIPKYEVGCRTSIQSETGVLLFHRCSVEAWDFLDAPCVSSAQIRDQPVKVNTGGPSSMPELQVIDMLWLEYSDITNFVI